MVADPQDLVFAEPDLPLDRFEHLMASTDTDIRAVGLDQPRLCWIKCRFCSPCAFDFRQQLTLGLEILCDGELVAQRRGEDDSWRYAVAASTKNLVDRLAVAIPVWSVARTPSQFLQRNTGCLLLLFLPAFTARLLALPNELFLLLGQHRFAGASFCWR